MDVARALSFDVPSSSIIPQEESLLLAGDVDEDVEIREQLVDPYPEIVQIEEPFDVPLYNLLPRWTKEANEGLKKYQRDMRSIETIRSDAERYGHLRMKAMKIVDDFWRPLELYVIASTKFETWYNELDEIAKNIRGDMSTKHVGAEHFIESGEPNEEMNYRDPPQSQCKGKRKPQRFKHPIEKKMRTCKSCHKKAGHNSRTCLKVQSQNQIQSETCS